MKNIKLLKFIAVFALILLNLSESYSVKRFVKLTGTQNKNYQGPHSWKDNESYSDIQEAINASQAGDIIYIQKGKYIPKFDINSSNTNKDKREFLYVLKEGVSLFGGFSGEIGTENDTTSRDVTKYKTIISGDQAGNDPVNMTWPNPDVSYTSLYGDNSYTLLTHKPNETLSNATIIDGIYFRAANNTKFDSSSNENISPSFWGAIHLKNSSPIFKNCYFENNIGYLENLNSATAVYALNCSPKFISCTFFRNYGNGIVSSFNSGKVLIDKCYIFENNSGDVGTLKAWNGGNFDCTNSLFRSNVSTLGGVAVIASNESPSKVLLQNCTIYGHNLTQLFGRIIYASSSVKDNVICDIENSIIWDCGAPGVKNDGYFYIYNGILNVKNTTLQYAWDGSGNNTDDPLFFYEPEDLRLKVGSPAINSSGEGTYKITEDIRGFARIGVPDRGCYEYYPIANVEYNINFSHNIYPNPAENYLVMDANSFSINQPITIFNVFGDEQNITLNKNDKNYVIDITNLNSGIYFIKNGNNISKFIKK